MHRLEQWFYLWRTKHAELGETGSPEAGTGSWAKTVAKLLQNLSDVIFNSQSEKDQHWVEYV